MDSQSVYSDERLSTPGDFGGRSDRRDFVRSHIPIQKQLTVLRDVRDLVDCGLISNGTDYHVSLQSIPEEERPESRMQTRKNEVYASPDSQRHVTVRESLGITPADARIAMAAARDQGPRSKLLFNPELQDTVNDTVRLIRDPCILSEVFWQSDKSRYLFQRQVAQDRNGIASLDLVRKLNDIYYMKVDFVDVVMFHPSAWGFPEADLNRVVVGVPGRERDPMHGWFWQRAVDADSEMRDVRFGYNVLVRRIPETLIEEMARARIPEWLQEVCDLKADTRKVEKLVSSSAVKWDDNAFMQSGLVDEKDVYIKFAQLRDVRTVEPDPLHATASQHSVKGLHGLRIALGAYNREARTATANQVKNIAYQLGIFEDFHFFWFALYVLNYPLPPHWAIEIERDTRVYVNVACNQRQLIHPLLPQFTQVLSDMKASDFLWDRRGSVLTTCDHCGSDDAVVSCLNCCDSFCPSCYVEVHSTRPHMALPLAGCRYLTEEEVKIFSPLISVTNVGFCNRRRFLARTNQSDKTGPCQCQYLHFGTETAFEAALMHCAQTRMELSYPPRLKNRNGFFYDFALDVVTDDDSFVTTSRIEQSASLVIQRWIRGVESRLKLKREIRACIVIQKNIRMVLVRRRFGLRTSGNALTIWYAKYMVRRKREITEKGIYRMQAMARSHIQRRLFQKKRDFVVKLQALVRGVLARKRLCERHSAVLKIQKKWKAIRYGPRYVCAMHLAATRIQALTRGVAVRMQRQKQLSNCIRIQAVMRGFLAKRRVRERGSSAALIQTWWRRYLSLTSVKLQLMQNLETCLRSYDDLIRQKSMKLSSTHIQSCWRRHLGRKKYIFMRESRLITSRGVASVAGLLGLVLSSGDRPIHPWFRYLPESVQSRLGMLKGVVQRAIIHSGLAVGGEILGSLVSEILKISGISDKRVSGGIQWTRHEIGHLLARLRDRSDAAHLFPRRPDDPLTSPIRGDYTSPIDHRFAIEEENFSILFLSLLPKEAASDVMIVSELLVTYREFLDQPRLKMDSNLGFQGVDSVAASQLLDIISGEFGLSLPREWSIGVGKSSCSAIKDSITHFVAQMNIPDKPRSIASIRKFKFFTRQDVLNACKALSRCLDSSSNQYPRHVSEILSLLAECRTPECGQEHTPIVLAVVVIHLVLRGTLMLRLAQRAAQVIQVKFRYVQNRSRSKRLSLPATTIQRYLRGLQARISLYRRNQAASVIQRNWRTICQLRRSVDLRNKVGKIQSMWRRAIQRKWLSRMHRSTTRIQALFRGHLVRLFMGRDGRVLRRAFLDQHASVADPVRQAALGLQYKSSLEDLKVRKLKANRSRAKIAQKKIEQFRTAVAKANVKSGPQQRIKRISMFEPPAFVSRRIARQKQPQTIEPVSDIVLACKVILPHEPSRRNPVSDCTNVHAAAKCGARALAAKSIGRSNNAVPKIDLSRSSPSSDSDQSRACCMANVHRMWYLPEAVKRTLVRTRGSADSTLMLSNAIAFSFLCRESGDSGRPNWAPCVPMIYHPSKDVMRSNIGESVVAVTALLGEKMRRSESPIPAAAELVRLLISVTLENSSGAELPCKILWIAELLRSGFARTAQSLTTTIDDHFTARQSMYRGIRLSRPEWSVLNRPIAETFSAACGVHVKVPEERSLTEDSLGNTVVKAARFLDFLADLHMVWFAEAVMNELLKQTHLTVYYFNSSRQLKRGPSETPKTTTWSDDVEIRSLVAAITRILKTVLTRSANPELFAAALLGNVLSGLWSGVERSDSFVDRIERINETASPTDENIIIISNPFSNRDMGRLLVLSRLQPSLRYTETIKAIPAGLLAAAAMRIQTYWRGSRVRKNAKYLKDVCKYMQLTHWPTVDPVVDTDGGLITATPMGEPKLPLSPSRNRPITPVSVGGKSHAFSERRELGQNLSSEDYPDLFQADHIACAKLYFILCFNVYLRIVMERYFGTIIKAFDRVTAVFSQLIAQEEKYAEVMAGVATDLKRVMASCKNLPEKVSAPPVVPQSLVSKLGREIREAFLSKRTVLKPPNGRKSLEEPKVAQKQEIEKTTAGPSSDQLYMNEYMKWMDGDDSMFRDISSEVNVSRPISGSDEHIPVEPLWLPVKASKYALARNRLITILKGERAKRQFALYEKNGHYIKALSVLSETWKGNLNILDIECRPTDQIMFWIENVFHLVVGFVALSVKAGTSAAVGLELIKAAQAALPSALKMLSPKHSAAIEAMLFDTGLGLAYACPEACLGEVQNWYTAVSQRYVTAGHAVRYSKICVRFACVLVKLSLHSQALFVLSKCIDKLEEDPATASSTLLLVAKLNRAVANTAVGQLEVAEVEARQVAKALTHNGGELSAIANEFKQRISTIRNSKLTSQ